MRGVKLFGGIALILSLFILVVLGISYLNGSNIESKNFEQESTNLIILEKENDIYSNRVIVSDKFVQNVEDGSQVITLSSNGRAYNLRQGTVLASEMVISYEGDQYSLDRIDHRRKSIN